MPVTDQGEGKKGSNKEECDYSTSSLKKSYHRRCILWGFQSKICLSYCMWSSSVVFEPHSFTAWATALSCFPSALEHNPFFSQAQAIQRTQKILTTAVQRNAERMSCDCLNLFLSLDKPSLGVFRTAEDRTDWLQGDCSLPVTDCSSWISVTFTAYPQAKGFGLGFSSSPRFEQFANMVLLRQTALEETVLTQGMWVWGQKVTTTNSTMIEEKP